MLILSAKIRKEKGKKVRALREKGILPAVLYGPEINSQSLEIDLKEFEKVYKEAGESSLISLSVEGKKEKFLVLIHDLQFDPLSSKPIHVDFYQPPKKEEIVVKVPLIFEGEARAIKELGGTLVKNISEIEIKALATELPHEIRVDLGKLKSFEDKILVKDLKLPEKIKVLRNQDEIVAQVLKPEKIEEELEKPIEEKLEAVEKIEKKPKEI